MRSGIKTTEDRATRATAFLNVAAALERVGGRHNLADQLAEKSKEVTAQMRGPGTPGAPADFGIDR